MLRFDLHVHTNYSKDGQSSVEDTLLAAKAAGLDGIAITDHNTTAGAVYALQVVDKVAPGLMVIPGVEVTTRSGHLIVLGITKDVTQGMPVEDTIKAAKAMGGIIVVPHPYQRLRHGMPIPAGADAVEVYNSRYIFGLHNRFTKHKARVLVLPAVAGSDAHIATLVGSAITDIDADKNVNNVLKAIKEGKTIITVGKTPTKVYASQIFNGWVKKLKAFFMHRYK